MVDARVSTPANQQEVLTLAIDRATSAEVSRINTEIGKSVYRREVRGGWGRLSQQARLWKDWQATYDAEKTAIALGKDHSYESLLNEYVSIKLYLHDLRRSMYYRGDPYCEREDIDVKGVIERCDELKQMIKAKRRVINFAAWGGMEPNRSSPYDKPLLYAMSDYTCSFIVNNESVEYVDDEDSTVYCPLNGEHWFHGQPYCRAHFGVARKLLKTKRREENTRRWQRVANCDPGCPILTRHTHTASGTDRW